MWQMTIFVLLSALVSLAALFSFVSHRFLRLPSTVGVMLLSLLGSFALILAGQKAPGLHRAAESLVAGIDFPQVVLHGMLGLLLFAGALHLDLTQLAKEKLPVLTLSIVSTILSTLAVAGLLYLILRLVGLPADALTCLLFGALISPTDPIAVLEMVRRVGAPLSLETQLTGESLFNDGVGAVIFLSVLEASSQGALPSSASCASSPRQCRRRLADRPRAWIPGVPPAFAWWTAIVSKFCSPSALAMGGYALADALHVSAPLEAVAAGLLVSGRARSSGHVRDHARQRRQVLGTDRRHPQRGPVSAARPSTAGDALAASISLRRTPGDSCRFACAALQRRIGGGQPALRASASAGHGSRPDLGRFTGSLVDRACAFALSRTNTQ